MPTLQELKGQRVVAKFTGLAGGTPAVGIVKVVEVEAAGVWIEYHYCPVVESRCSCN